MTRLAAFLFGLLALPLASIGCSSSTNDACYDVPTLTVTNAATGAPICDATVTLTWADAGSTAITLEVFTNVYDSGDACTYADPIGVGSYTVHVTRAGFRPSATPGYDVGKISCDTTGSRTPRRVEVALMPQP